MLAADRAHMNLRDFMGLPTAYREMYRTAVMAERRAQDTLAKRNARREKMRRMIGGRR